MTIVCKIISLFTFYLFMIFSVQAQDPVVVGYFPEWGIYDRNYHIADIPANKLTHVIYAFAKISTSGEVELFDSYAATDKAYPGDTWDEHLRGNFKQLKILKKKYPHLKTLIAIGGWTLSDPFTDVALTQESRRKFATSAVNFMCKYDFDGLDIDWEYPVGGGIAKGRPEDKKNFTLLIAELRNQLTILEENTNRKYLLTVASSAGDALNNYELNHVAQYIDWYNLMTYDFHGSWEQTTNHQAPLYPTSLDSSPLAPRYHILYAVNSYIQAGVAPSKIVLGIPLYSRGWAGVGRENGGFLQPAKGPCKGTWEPGVVDYKELYKKIQEQPNEYLLYRDEEAKTSWIYNPYEEGGVFYTYEDVETVKEKVKFIKNQNLRGAMFWEFSSDLRETDHPHSIVNVVNQALLSDKKVR